MSNKSSSLEDVSAMAKKYIANQAELLELKMVSKSSTILANMMTEIVVALSAVLAFLFGSVTLGFWLGDAFQSNTKGFGLVAILYVIIAIVVGLTKDKYIEKIIINRIIKKYGDGEK